MLVTMLVVLLVVVSLTSLLSLLKQRATAKAQLVHASELTDAYREAYDKANQDYDEAVALCKKWEQVAKQYELKLNELLVQTQLDQSMILALKSQLKANEVPPLHGDPFEDEQPPLPDGIPVSPPVGKSEKQWRRDN